MHRFAPRDTAMIAWLLLTLCLATLTLWMQSYWPVTVFQVSLLLLAAVTLLGGKAPPPAARFPLYPLLFMVLWGGVQLLTGQTVYRFVTERATVQWMTWAALYYVVVCCLGGRNRVKRVRLALVWFGCGLAIEAILQAYLTPGKAFFLFPTGYREFVMGPIIYHTHYAVIVEAILPMALFFALNEAKGSVPFLAVTAILLASVAVSASRGGVILAAAEVAAVIVLYQLRQPRADRRVLSRVLALTAVTVVFAAIAGFATVSHRFQGESLAVDRMRFAHSTFQMIRVHPFMGWGLGTWPTVYPAYATFDAGALVNQAHTDWLQWVAEGGLPAGFAMISLAAWACRPAIRSIWGLGVLGVLVHALFDYPFSRSAVGAWPFLVLAMAAVTGGKSTLEKTIPD